MARATTKISANESNILVAIGKLETQMDGVRVDIAGARTEIKEINSGLANRVLNLEGNAISKFEFDALQLRVDQSENKITQVYAWGAAGLVFLGVAEFALQYLFK